jgi:hypothetical protein
VIDVVKSAGWSGLTHIKWNNVNGEGALVKDKGKVVPVL